MFVQMKTLTVFKTVYKPINLLTNRIFKTLFNRKGLHFMKEEGSDGQM